MRAATVRLRRKKTMRSRTNKLSSPKRGKLSRNDVPLAEVLKVIQISQEVQDAQGKSPDKNRRVISSQDFLDDLPLVQFNN